MDQLVKGLEVRKLQLKRMESRTSPVADADMQMVIKYIDAYEKELAQRGSKIKDSQALKIGLTGASAVLGAGGGYFIAKAFKQKGWLGATILGLAVGASAFFIIKPLQQKEI